MALFLSVYVMDKIDLQLEPNCLTQHVLLYAMKATLSLVQEVAIVLCQEYGMVVVYNAMVSWNEQLGSEISFVKSKISIWRNKVCCVTITTVGRIIPLGIHNLRSLTTFKDLGTLITKHNVHRFLFKLHSLKITKLPLNITSWGAVVFEKWVE